MSIWYADSQFFLRY